MTLFISLRTIHSYAHALFSPASNPRCQKVRRFQGKILGIIMICFCAAVAQTQTFTTLVNFDGTNGNAVPFQALVQGMDGNFYGATEGNVGSSYGSIFEMTPDGTLTTLHSFGDYTYVFGPLVQVADGSFYGASVIGGASDDGEVFEITSEGVFTTIYSFSENWFGSAKAYSGLLQASDGNLYGTTNGGYNYGTIYRVTPEGSVTTVAIFHRYDGEAPNALIQATDGNLYGTAAIGGVNEDGTVFKLTLSGVLTTLHNFNGTDGGDPTYAGLVQASDGNFYGTTTQGGSHNHGTVFKITPTGSLTTLHNFNVSDGSEPEAALIQASDGNLYGTTTLGGDVNAGTVFKITPAGVLTTLHSFAYTDGRLPECALVQGADGDFYGSTAFGGTHSQGTIFRLSMGLGALSKDKTDLH
jgi:uncharacterized repeat protein (TIGR03803 family)